jgi:hypothetical protein
MGHQLFSHALVHPPTNNITIGTGQVDVIRVTVSSQTFAAGDVVKLDGNTSTAIGGDVFVIVGNPVVPVAATTTGCSQIVTHCYGVLLHAVASTDTSAYVMIRGNAQVLCDKITTNLLMDAGLGAAIATADGNSLSSVTDLATAFRCKCVGIKITETFTSTTAALSPVCFNGIEGFGTSQGE